MSTGIVHRQTPEEEELARKRAELDALEAELAERELDLATLLSELHRFDLHYLHVVGARYAELDELQAQIAEARARQTSDDPRARQQATDARARAEESAETAAKGRAAEPRFQPSERLRKLFREVARRVHPDLANNDGERARRTRLMAEANGAYEKGDEARLEAILREWETSPESVAGEGPGAELVRVIRKIAQVHARLEAIDAEVARLKDSPLWTLKAKVEDAEGEGRDLLTEMVTALDQQLSDAREVLARVTTEAPGA